MYRSRKITNFSLVILAIILIIVVSGVALRSECADYIPKNALLYSKVTNHISVTIFNRGVEKPLGFITQMILNSFPQWSGQDGYSYLPDNYSKPDDYRQMIFSRIPHYFFCGKYK